jgi:hypothetical protein
MCCFVLLLTYPAQSIHHNAHHNAPTNLAHETIKSTPTIHPFVQPLTIIGSKQRDRVCAPCICFCFLC